MGPGTSAIQAGPQVVSHTQAADPDLDQWPRGGWNVNDGHAPRPEGIFRGSWDLLHCVARLCSRELAGFASAATSGAVIGLVLEIPTTDS